MSLGAGRPDWTPLNVQGGYEIFSTSQTYASGATLFSGFVGTWSYLNVLTTGFTTAAYVKYTITYYADSGYLTQAGSQSFVRYYNQTAHTQYATLGPWCKITITTDTGGYVSFNAMNVYGSQGGAGGARLSPAYVPLYAAQPSVPANTVVYELPLLIIPGPAVLSVLANVATWHVIMRYYDFLSSSFLEYFIVSNSSAGPGGTWRVPCLDTPAEVEIGNFTTSAGVIHVDWAADGY